MFVCRTVVDDVVVVLSWCIFKIFGNFSDFCCCCLLTGYFPCFPRFLDSFLLTNWLPQWCFLYRNFDKLLSNKHPKSKCSINRGFQELSNGLETRKIPFFFVKIWASKLCCRIRFFLLLFSNAIIPIVSVSLSFVATSLL